MILGNPGRGISAASLALLALLAVASVPAMGRDSPPGEPGELVPVAKDGLTRLVYVSGSGAETTLRTTEAVVFGERSVLVPDAGVLFASWEEAAASGGSQHLVTLSLDGGASWGRPQVLTFDIPLKAGRISTTGPGGVPPLPAELLSGDEDALFIVQFETMGLEAWRRMLQSVGAEVLSYVPEHSQIVRVDPTLLSRISSQPFVRWVGRYEPGYKIDPAVLAEISSAASCADARRYNLQTFSPGPAEKTLLAEEVRAIGGRVDLQIPNGYRIQATMTLDQVVRIAHSNHLLWIDRWSAPENDMDIVREQDGANYVESVGGYSGQGVRGEVMDCGIMQTHMDDDGMLIHGPASSVCDHGTCAYGIVFGNGNRDGDGEARATGNIPSAQGYFYDYDNLIDRYQETAELVQSPIFASFQSNSWGSARTPSYDSTSAEMDDIIYLYDIPIFQSQSNAGSQDSRPQAWAKNAISVGGVYHYDTQSLTDDCWCSGSSIGPAEDGRIKPDLCHWYDKIYTTDLEPGGYLPGSDYFDSFGGTSAATPIVAGVGALILQMWADNILGNNPPGTTVFEKRPHASTTKALMINTAEQYPFSGTAHDLTRTHQGWGLPSAGRFYDRAPLIKVVDETEVLGENDVHAWTTTVAAGQPELKITLVYTDRAGTTSSTLHRINDVSLKVIAPGGSVFWWGNNGLAAGNWSQPGGGPDTKNTVENVFIQNPVAGAWTIEISADDLNEDEHVETPEIDQDYALVVYGGTSLVFGCSSPPPAPSGLTANPNGDNRVDLAWTPTSTARGYRIYRSLGGCGGTSVLLASLPSTQTTFSDMSVSGGTTYGYVVRALEACESNSSNCASATAVGPCTLAPSFAGIISASSNDAATCGVMLTWSTASPNCGGPVLYNVYRSTSSGFTPSESNRVASCVGVTSLNETHNLASSLTYYYIVRAEDVGGRGGITCGGAVESNTITRSALVKGPTSVLLNSSFEAGLEGWVPAKGSPPATRGDFEAGTPNPTVKGGQLAQPGSCPGGAKCLYTERNNGSNPDNGDVDAGEVLATSPSFNAGGYATARLTFYRWHFNSAAANDPGDYYKLDASNDNGSNWTNLETLGPQTSANSWNQLTFDLQNYTGLTPQMRLRVRSADGVAGDSTVETAIDSVHVEGAQGCTPVTSPAPGYMNDNSVRIAREGTKVRITWNADCSGPTGYSLYRGELAAGYPSIAPVPGYCGIGIASTLVDPGPGSYFFLVTPNDGSVEGSLGNASDGTRRPQASQPCFPRAIHINACGPDQDEDGDPDTSDCNDANPNIYIGAPELCNALDDDCDGSVDETFGLKSCGAGACRRTVQSCVGGVPQTCIPGSPTPETCNDIDDNCNGIKDDLGQTTCGIGACQRTVSNCIDGVPQTCSPGSPSTEICNGIDDDCDSMSDENLGQTSCGVGACFRIVNNCSGGVPQTCYPGAPAPETCNSIDDDCDGSVDDGISPTTCGVGACRRTVPGCVNGLPQTCTPGTPTQEICNGVDDDCNNVVDDNGDTDRDGIFDCQDPDDDNDGFLDTADCAPLVNSVHSLPGEVAATLHFVNTQNFGWTRIPQSNVYNVYRGTIATGGWTYNHACLEAESPDQLSSDVNVPPAGQSYYYLVSPRNRCGEGSLGSQTSGQPRPVGNPCPSGGNDSDGDTVPDIDDNCPLQFNPDQTDSNNNTIGDACEQS